MEFTVSTKLDMVNAIQRLKQGDIPTYVIKHRLGTTYYTVDFEQYEKGGSDFYHKTSSSEPIVNPYYVEPKKEEPEQELPQEVTSEQPVMDEITEQPVVEESVEEPVVEEEQPEVNKDITEDNNSVLNLQEQQNANGVLESDNTQKENTESEEVIQDEWSKWVQLQQDYEKAQQEIVELTQQNIEAVNRNIEIQKEIESLIVEKQQLQEELDKLKSSKEEIPAGIEDLCDYDLEDIIDEIITRGFSIELTRTAKC